MIPVSNFGVDPIILFHKSKQHCSGCGKFNFCKNYKALELMLRNNAPPILKLYKHLQFNFHIIALSTGKIHS
jgi:hypothetical protein